MVVHDPGLFIVYLRMCVGFEDAPRPDSFLKSGKCRSITYSGDFATLPPDCAEAFMELIPI